MMNDLPARDVSPRHAAPARTRAVVALLVAIVCLGLRWPLLTQPGFIQDQVYFLHWASLAEHGGVSAVYESRANGRPWCNYPPLYPYVLRSLAGVYRMGIGQSIDNVVISDLVERRQTRESAVASALFKMPAVIADALTCSLLVLWLARRTSLRMAAGLALLYAFMPAVVFDSAIWAQVDSIPTLFTLIALECVTRRRWAWVGVFAALAALAKPQALLLAPLYLVAALFTERRLAMVSISSLAAGALAAAALMMAPLWSVRENVVKAYTDAAGFYPFVHLNGFSAWFLANPLVAPRLDALTTFYRRDDQPLALGFTPKHAGLAAMGLLTAAILVQVIVRRATESVVQHGTRVLPLAFVVLCTQMHERYVVPVIAFWVWAYHPSIRWWVCWLVIGAVASTNLLWVWEQPLPVDLASSLAAWTRTTHAGVTTGACCAIALIGALILSLIGFDRKALPEPIVAT